MLVILSSLVLSTALAQSPTWPDGAGEYRFGMSRAAVMRACVASGGEYDRERERCSKASDAIGLGVVASSRIDFAFCRQRLCYLSIDARYAEIARAREVYAQLRGGIESGFGSVAGRVQDRSLMSHQCQRNDAALRECLRSQQAVIGQRWEFMNDPTVSSPNVEIDLRVIEALDADALVLTLRYAKREGLEARAALEERLAAPSNAPNAPVP